ISYGQNSLLSLFILAAVYVLLRHGHDRIAGAVLGCLLYKPQLVVLLAALLLLDRRWRALAGLGATAVLLAAVALALSVPATLAYLALSRSFATMLGEPGFPTAKMHSLYSFFVLLFPGYLTAAAALGAGDRRSGLLPARHGPTARGVERKPEGSRARPRREGRPAHVAARLLVADRAHGRRHVVRARRIAVPLRPSPELRDSVLVEEDPAGASYHDLDAVLEVPAQQDQVRGAEAQDGR